MIQFAKLSGFSPIIATASKKHESYLKSFGATHVIDRSIEASALLAEVHKITDTPIDIVYDSVGSADTQNAGYNLLGPGGKLVLVLPSALGDKDEDGKKVISTFGSPFSPVNKELFTGLYAKLNTYLVDGAVQVRSLILSTFV